MQYRKAIVAISGQPIASNSGIPMVLSDHVQDWLNAGSRTILAIVQEAPTAEGWRDLGRLLLERLLIGEGELGLFVDGTTVSIDTFLRWMRSVSEDRATGTAVLRVDVRPHPRKSDLRIVNIRWMSLQRSTSIAWLDSLWDDLPSDVFHVGTDLLLAVFPPGLSVGLSSQENMQFNSFLDGLNMAESWLIPMDGNIGFFVGLPGDRALQAEV
jgi:hypothetical protein